MRILLIRHAQDARDYRGGWSRRGLIAEGVAQAQALAQALQTSWQPINRLISSDLPRAAETAVFVSDALRIPIEYDPAWREMNNGDLAGMYNPEAERRYPDLYFAALGIDEAYPNGESPRQHFVRTQAAFCRLCGQMEHTPSQTVAVITHGGSINIIYHLIKGWKWSNKAPFVPQAATSIHELRFSGNLWQLTQENNCDHLGEH